MSFISKPSLSPLDGNFPWESYASLLFLRGCAAVGAGLQTANLTTSPQPSSGAQVDVTAQDAVLLQLLFLTDLSLCLVEKKRTMAVYQHW